ncbi:MAG TPA: hypothetical protein VHP63_00705 [candidate division Zixibacteria bacterium]|nr:hypothetical protein [candidate division Zixibacteria bacterium]
MARLGKRLLFVSLSVLLLASCVKIETGQTLEEATESNELRARQVRSQWANQLNAATPLETANLLKQHMDSVSAMYLRYGFKVVDEWHKGNEGRGKVIDAAEMRQVVDAWVAGQKPILDAYEHNLEFGLDQLRLSKFFAPETMAMFEKFGEEFYEVRSVVFYPNRDVETYENKLLESQKLIETASLELGSELAKY